MAANSIVVATDGSRESVLSVEWAALEANRRGAPLRIVSTPAMPPRMRAGAYGSPETVADALQAASVQALATAAGRAAEVAPNVRVETGLLSGAPAQAIIDAASSASMLVVGARGTGGFAAMILGSVSRYAAMHAACPVVVAQGESLAVHQQIAVGVGDPDEAASAAVRIRRSGPARRGPARRPRLVLAAGTAAGLGRRGSPHRGDGRDRATAARPGGHLRGVRPPAR
jgi:nucleotide-binding universal stress UspA family protein